jgi:4-aminobutyrate aminotransferase
MLGVVLKLPDGSKAVDAAEWMMYRALDKGLSFKITMGCILTLTPALTIEEDDLALALTILDECFQEMPTELTLSKS